MEYCENQTLRQLIDSGDLVSSPDHVWRLFREVVEGLEHIHSKVCPIPMSLTSSLSHSHAACVSINDFVLRNNLAHVHTHDVMHDNRGCGMKVCESMKSSRLEFYKHYS